MSPRTSSLTLALCGVASSAIAQTNEQHLDRPWGLYARAIAGEASIIPSDELIAALQYDGSSSYGGRAQDFESVFDAYDTFIIEDISTTFDSSLAAWRSFGFATGNPFGAEDVVVRIFEDNGTGLPGSDSYTGEVVLTSTRRAGFYNGQEWVTDFGGQCLPAGSYFLVWAARMDFGLFGSAFFFMQDGDPTIGGGLPDNGWFWNPGEGLGWGVHIPMIDGFSGKRTGANYLLFGTPGDCSPPCANPDCPADFDFDGDTDGDDFFAYLDLFAADDPCADLDNDADTDADDFFAYLDLFVQGCD